MMKRFAAILALAILLTSSIGFAEAIDTTQRVKLHMVVLGDRPQDADLVYGMLSEKALQDINAELEIEFLAMSDYQEKYPLMLASGEPIDLIYTSAWCFYAQEATKGSFVEVTEDILKTYMPMTYAQQNPLSFEQSVINGKVYFVPFNLPSFIGDYNVAALIRGDLREKYGLDAPASIDDMVTYFDHVLQEEHGVGILPYAASQNNNALVGATCAANNWCVINGLKDFFVFPYSETPSPDDVTFLFETQAYKENAYLMKEWADKGYWSKNAIANQTAPADSFKNGLSATYFADVNTVGVVAKAVEQEHPEWKPEMYDINPGTIHTYGSYNGDGIAVPISSQNPERAFMLLDLLKFDRSYYELFRFGVEGKHWIAVGDDQWESGPDQTSYPYGTGTWGIKNELFERTRTDVFPTVTEIFDAWTVVDTPWAAFIFDDTNVKNEMAVLNNLLIQYDYILDLGMAEDVDATIEEFLSKCELAGLEKVKLELNDQLTAFIQEQES